MGAPVYTRRKKLADHVPRARHHLLPLLGLQYSIIYIQTSRYPMAGNRGIAGMGYDHDLFHLFTNTDIYPTKALNMKQVLFILIGVILTTVTFAQQPTATVASGKHIVVAYVTSWTDRMPDPTYVTHVNYAFGHVNDSFGGIRISNPNRLTRLTALKTAHPSLHVLLSIGGWGSGRFSEMAASKDLRRAFAADCRRVIEEFALDRSEEHTS